LVNYDSSTQLTMSSLLQDLVIVVRDWKSPGQFRFGWEGGQDYMNYLLSQKCTDGQTQAFFRELEFSFKSIRVFLMPAPNAELMWKPSPACAMKGKTCYRLP